MHPSCAMSSTPQSSRWDDHTKKIIQHTVAKGLSPADFAHFEHLCLSKGLDPLAREVYAITRGGKTSIQVSIDGFMAMANRTGLLDGMEVIYYDGEGNGSEVWLSKDAPVACLVRVWRKGCTHPFSASVRMDSYRQNSPLWRNMAEVLLSKCGVTLARRRGFADIMSGLYSAEEMDQAGLAVPELMEQNTSADTPAVETPEVPKSQEPSPTGKTGPSSTKKASRTRPTPASPPPAQAPAADAKAPEAAAEALAQATGGTVLEELRSAPAEAAEKGTDPLPENPPEQYSKGSCAALWRKARNSGVTRHGFQTLERQCGGQITPDRATKAIPALGDRTKVQHLNSGLTTQGQPLS